MLDFTQDITPHASMVDANWQLMLEHAARFDAMDNDNVPEGGMGFDMKFFHGFAEVSAHPCGSACCIAGWVAVWGQACGEYHEEDALVHTWGLPRITACCAANPEVKSPAWTATPQQAASLIRHLVATGEVDWPRAMGVV